MIGDGNPLYDIKPRRRYGFGTQKTKEREERRSCFFRFLFPGNRTVGNNRTAGAEPSGLVGGFGGTQAGAAGYGICGRTTDRNRTTVTTGTMQTTQRMQIMRTKRKQNTENLQSRADAPGGKFPDGTERGRTRFPCV